ncbi:MAG: NAD(P)-dependent oxidoreductase [Bacteroidota bacterium]
MKIGILRETKTPPDKRVPLTPVQCRELIEKYPGIEIQVQPDDNRAYSNKEYRVEKIPLNDKLSDCDLLLGVKEVDISSLIANKTYLFFSHTAKKQAHNHDLLKAILTKKITLIDYEYLTKDDNTRIVAFGRWAGIVGAYNALIAYGKRYHQFELKPAWECKDLAQLFGELNKVKISNIKILITGGGRVAHGAMETLSNAGIKKINPDKFTSRQYNTAVFTQLDPWHYTKPMDGRKFDLNHFFTFPEEYENAFLPYTRITDMLIACHYWDPRSPVFMTKEDMKQEDFRIKIIADVSCDINGPIPSTLRASTIEDPVYGYDPINEVEADPWAPGNILVMAVDNLPGELPRDASNDFGRKLIDEVMPYLLGIKKGNILDHATIVKQGKLTDKFVYLKDFAEGKGR